MDKKQILKLYALNRKFPTAIRIGIVENSWIQYAINFEKTLSPSKGESYEYRASQNIPGTEIDDINSLRRFYYQKITEDLKLHTLISQFDNVHHVRFAMLDPLAKIPMHLDDPRYLRFICMLEGSHTYIPEKGDPIHMSAGEVWFVNGSYRHSVENNSDSPRLAILGNFDNNEKNSNIILKERR